MQTYFVIIDNLIKANISVTKDTVLQAFNGTGPGLTTFEGCSGIVSFDPATGSRSAVTQIPQFDLVSLTPDYWQVCMSQSTLTHLFILARDRPIGKRVEHSFSFAHSVTLLKEVIDEIWNVFV